MGITIKSSREIELMKKAGWIVGTVLQTLAKSVKPGMKTRDLDLIARGELEKLGGKPSFLGYAGFPATVCVSVNEEIVHGIPGDRVLLEGDIVSLDFGAIYEEYQGDSAITVGVGKISREAKDLLKVTEGSLWAGINVARDKARLGDISHAIQKYVESHGYSVVREYTGHGIGREMHEDPQIPNYGRPGTGLLLKKGMTMALEPMVNIGSYRTRVGRDHWTVSTADGSLSAHFEHSIAITDGEPLVLTAVG